MSEQGKTILIVDDEEKNVRLLTLLCRNLGHRTQSAANGALALKMIEEETPDLVLMDLMMPEMDGFTATGMIKKNERTAHIPVIIVTALDSREDRLKGIEQGADDFLTKPVDAAELSLRLRNNLRNKEYHDFLADHNRILQEKVAARTQELREGYIDTINRLTLASEFKDDETGMHIRRTSHYTSELARVIGLGEDFADTIFYAAPMHDVGKVAIPDAVLLKEGPLDDDEWRIMRTHAEIGAQILAGSASPFLVMAVDIAHCHHERWDGGGYPRGLKGEEIPMAARIMNICDQYDALRSKRPYKPAFDHEKSCRIILEGDGRTMPEHFDPRVLEAFRASRDRFAGIFESMADEEGGE